jgi:hypothetical protein
MLQKMILFLIILSCFNEAQASDNPQDRMLIAHTSANYLPFYFPPPPVSSFKYMHCYNGWWQDSSHTFQGYYNPSLNVNPIDFGIYQATTEESMRLNIAYDAYRQISEISACIHNFKNNAVSHDSLAQRKAITFHLLILTQLEESLWHEYVIYNGIWNNNPVLGNERVYTIRAQQSLLATEMGQLQRLKRTNPYRKIKKIWERYKVNNCALEKLNNDAISQIMFQFDQYPILRSNPHLIHELAYRKKYQSYKYWMTFAEKHEHSLLSR